MCHGSTASRGLRYDAALREVWVLIDDRFGFRTSPSFLKDCLQNVAERNRYHPVRDYLSRLEWDEEPRIDNWLSFYLGAEDTPYTRAVGRLLLLAAVRRASSINFRSTSLTSGKSVWMMSTLTCSPFWMR